eukprot:UN12295
MDYIGYISKIALMPHRAPVFNRDDGIYMRNAHIHQYFEGSLKTKLSTSPGGRFGFGPLFFAATGKTEYNDDENIYHYNVQTKGFSGNVVHNENGEIFGLITGAEKSWFYPFKSGPNKITKLDNDFFYKPIMK